MNTKYVVKYDPRVRAAVVFADNDRVAEVPDTDAEATKSLAMRYGYQLEDGAFSLGGVNLPEFVDALSARFPVEEVS
jgi:hypothetical protein